MKRKFKITCLLSFTLLICLTQLTSVSSAEDNIDGACDSRLKGTMSLESCLGACTTAGYTCGLAIKYEADIEDDLDEDLECYGCRKYVCADFGRLNAAGKAHCDVTPDKKSIPALPLPDGTPCWQCIDDKDTCSTKWPGSTVLATCQAACPKGAAKCIKVGKHDKKKCYQCRAIVPLPPPPKTCRKMGLLVAGQCKTCKDPKPLCVPAGVVAVNGACFECAEKPKVKCSEFGLKESCNCKKDETKVVHFKTKQFPNGIKVRKKCCECVKKPEECGDINLYTLSSCQNACKKPGKCKKVARVKSGDCYDCISPITCEESSYESSCKPCDEDDLACRDVTTKDGVLCKECFIKPTCEELGFHDNCQPCVEKQQGCHDISPTASGAEELVCKECFGKKSDCKEGGLPGACPGTCRRGQLCIKKAGPCHMCMTIKSIEVTWIIVIIETPYGRVVLNQKELDEAGLAQFKPTSIMALATKDEIGVDIGAESEGLASLKDVYEETAESSGSTQKIAQTLKAKLESQRRRFSDECFNDFQAVSVDKKPPPSKSEFGANEEDNTVLNGPVITCGTIGKENAFVVFDASGALIELITKEDLENNPNIIEEALTKAGVNSQLHLSLKGPSSQEVDAKATAEISTDTDGSANPNDPLYYKATKKKKRGLLGLIVGSGDGMKGAGVSVGGGGLSGAVWGGNAGVKVGRKKSGPEMKDQWGIQQVGYRPKSDPDSAWNVFEATKKNILVAVIDSGLDYTHPDAPAFTWINKNEIPDNNIDDDLNGYIDDVEGWNFHNNNNDLTDLKGHGTFVSGIIAAKTNNGIGMAGINPGAVIMPLKVTNRKGKTTSLTIFRAIHYAVDQGARIINLSLGGRGISKLEQHALNYAYANGVLVVVASGNTGDYFGEIGPASARRVSAIGAMDFNGQRSTISSWGPNNALIAPGELILSLQSKDAPQEGGARVDDKNYYRQSGTSFSAPMIVATASLLLAQNPSLSVYELEDILMGTAIDLDKPGWDGKTGAGLLNATAALKVEDPDFLTVKITKFQSNYNKKKKLTSVDVYGTVRGPLDQFEIGVGKGKRAKRFKTGAGPFSEEADHDWIAQISEKDLKGSKEWVVQLKATGLGGEEKIAEALLLIKRKK